MIHGRYGAFTDPSGPASRPCRILWSRRDGFDRREEEDIAGSGRSSEARDDESAAEIDRG